MVFLFLFRCRTRPDPIHKLYMSWTSTEQTTKPKCCIIYRLWRAPSGLLLYVGNTYYIELISYWRHCDKEDSQDDRLVVNLYFTVFRDDLRRFPSFYHNFGMFIIGSRKKLMTCVCVQLGFGKLFVSFYIIR